jgi:hypothetical protein
VKLLARLRRAGFFNDVLSIMTSYEPEQPLRNWKHNSTSQYQVRIQKWALLLSMPQMAMRTLESVDSRLARLQPIP